MEKLILVYEGPEMEVNIIKSILNDNSIECSIRNDVQSARLAGFGAVFNKIYVLESDVEASKLWIKEYENAG